MYLPDFSVSYAPTNRTTLSFSLPVMFGDRSQAIHSGGTTVSRYTTQAGALPIQVSWFEDGCCTRRPILHRTSPWVLAYSFRPEMTLLPTSHKARTKVGCAVSSFLCT